MNHTLVDLIDISKSFGDQIVLDKLNLSIRGVDAARYRLRKKFNLTPEDSLTAFMISFK